MIASIILAATIIENAIAVTNAAAEIDAAIVAKGGVLVGGGGLRNAAAGILTIPTGGVIEPLAVATNGVYYAPAGVDGFNPVTVTVTPVPPPVTREVFDYPDGGSTPYAFEDEASQSGVELWYLGADGQPIARCTSLGPADSPVPPPSIPDVVTVGGDTPYAVPASVSLSGETLYYLGAGGEPLDDTTAIENVE